MSGGVVRSSWSGNGAMRWVITDDEEIDDSGETIL